MGWNELDGALYDDKGGAGAAGPEVQPLLPRVCVLEGAPQLVEGAEARGTMLLTWGAPQLEDGREGAPQLDEGGDDLGGPYLLDGGAGGAGAPQLCDGGDDLGGPQLEEGRRGECCFLAGGGGPYDWLGRLGGAPQLDDGGGAGRAGGAPYELDGLCADGYDPPEEAPGAEQLLDGCEGRELNDGAGPEAGGRQELAGGECLDGGRQPLFSGASRFDPAATSRGKATTQTATAQRSCQSKSCVCRKTRKLVFCAAANVLSVCMSVCVCGFDHLPQRKTSSSCA